MDRKQKHFHKVVLEQTSDMLYILPNCLPGKYILRTKDKQFQVYILDGNETLG